MRRFITTLGFTMLLLILTTMSSDPCNVGLVGETEDGNFHYYPQNEALQFSGNVESEGSNQWIFNDSEDRSSTSSSSSSAIGGIPGLPPGDGGDVTTINGGTDPPFQFASWRSIIGSRSKMRCGSSVGGYGRGGTAGGGGGGGGGGGRRYLRGGGNDDGKSNENNISDKVQ